MAESQDNPDTCLKENKTGNILLNKLNSNVNQIQRFKHSQLVQGADIYSIDRAKKHGDNILAKKSNECKLSLIMNKRKHNFHKAAYAIWRLRSP